MSILDIIVIIFLILGGLIGYKEGAITSILHMVGSLVIFIISFYLKGPVSIILFEHLPFSIHGGLFNSISSVNFLIYEGIAFLICEIILTIILKIIMKFTGVMNKVINMTIILALPNKIIGAFFGVLRFFIFGFFLLFISSVIPMTSKYIKDSKVSVAILNNTPILSNVTNDFNKSIKDIYALIDKYDGVTEETKENLDYDTLEILLKYKIVSVDTVKKMNENNKLNIENIDELLEKYKK